MSVPQPPPGEIPLHRWLTERLGVYLDRAPKDVDLTVPLAAYGLDSVAALVLCGDVEDDLGLALDPAWVWEHPTAGALAAHLVRRLADLQGRLPYGPSGAGAPCQ